MVKAWSEEPVLALAKAWVYGSEAPDVRIFGAVDKPQAGPGERLQYTYYLFNSGMDFASELNVDIPVPEAGSLLVGTISGDPGKATLMPSKVQIDLSRAGVVAQPGSKTTSIKWEPDGLLGPGELVRISFQVVIN